MEESDIEGLLRTLDSRFTFLERLILGQSGTVVTFLSLVFGNLVTVNLVSQWECPDPSKKDGTIHRNVELICKSRKICRASSSIPKDRNRSEVIDDILASRLGLGHIVAKHNIPNRRILLHIDCTEHLFYRTYRIEGAEVYITITEWFPKKEFQCVESLLSAQASEGLFSTGYLKGAMV